MEHVIYDKPPYVQVVHRAELNYIAVNWTDFFISLKDIQEMHHKALEFAKKNHCYYYMAETSKVKTLLTSDIIEWWSDWVVVMADAGVKGIITVVPTHLFGQISTLKWQAEVINGIMMKNVKTVEEGETVIQELQQASP